MTAVICTIPPRRAMLGRALASVFSQTVLPDAVVVAVDTDHAGVWVTRERGIKMARTPFVALGDDDDEWLPFHLERLLRRQAETGADLVYPCYEGGPDLGLCGAEFNRATMATVTITVLVRTALAAVIPLGPPNPGEVNANDDHRLLYGILDRGGTVAHEPTATWVYRMHHGHTSGRPERW